MKGKCDVCALVDGDRSEKDVAYCGRCDAHMCERCRKSTARRAAAMIKRGLGFKA